MDNSLHVVLKSDGNYKCNGYSYVLNSNTKIIVILC